MSKEALKSMITNLINDKNTEADLDFSTYVTAKMKDVAGFNEPDVVPDEPEHNEEVE